MQTWAKRGFQTALVTGGLLMLGTGIASADDNVNPDTPASALDAHIVVDAKVHDNAIGTVLGDSRLPDVNRTISTSPRELLNATPVGALATPVLDDASERLLTGTDAPLRGNKIVGDVVVPVDVSGNAIALTGDAESTTDSTQTTELSTPVGTSGEDRAIAGNVVDLDYAAPIQVTGNAIGAIGNAKTHNTASQTTTADGDITTDGQYGTLAGNVVAPQLTTPVQGNGNAVAVIGNADAVSDTTSTSTVGGVIRTDGGQSTLSGNGAAIPLAAPVRATGQALNVIGNAHSESTNSTSAQAGAEAPDFNNNPTYVFSNGIESTGGGNIAQTPFSTPVTVDCAVGGLVGNAGGTCTSDVTSVAGGGNRSWGNDSVLGGAIAATGTAAPVSVIGSAAGVLENVSTDQNNTVNTIAGGHSRTRGEDGVLSGSLANLSTSAPIDSCANGGAIAGDSDIACSNITTTGAGGDAGSTGDDSVGGGNGADVPVSVPVELISNGFDALGDGDISATESKFSAAGGDANTADDDAVLAANMITAPVVAPVQAFGNVIGAAANTDSDTALENQISAGGPAVGSGVGGTGSGNLVNTPAVLPVQAFGLGATAIGDGKAVASNVTSTSAGGSSTSDGTDGTLSGNVVHGPIAGAIQPFGSSVALLGDNTATADNTLDMLAGGGADTTGEDGFGSGNLIAPQALPVVQAFGDAVSGVGGDNVAHSSSTTTGTTGGDLNTNGDDGFLSGNLADVPAIVAAQPHGDAVSAIGSDAIGVSNNDITGQAGGTSTTSGHDGSLSGIDLTAPVKGNAPVRDVPVEVLADALTSATQSSDLTVGEHHDTDQDGALRLPEAGGLGVTEVPSLLSGLPMARSAMPRSAMGNPLGNPLGGLLGGGSSNPLTSPLTGGLSTGSLTGALPTSDLLHGLPVGGGLPVAGGLANGLPMAGGLPVAGDLTGGLPVHVVPGVGRSSVSRSGVPSLPAVPALPAVSSVPGLDNLSGAFAGNLFEAPSLGHLPVQAPIQAPALNGVQTPALSGLDATSALPGVSSLTDTRSRLANLFDLG
ncbi:beta strand repeat-containing protein [Actinokineospora enzanensis]|uniref:beta strand repeat-containing protein n=1 Tax=Actinokineospora enzanensis TaxID=155975 RepID=UPI00039E0851|nr:hypothetical protein [Actinokineospora enzanensis]